jgi:hypothetical protein
MKTKLTEFGLTSVLLLVRQNNRPSINQTRINDNKNLLEYNYKCRWWSSVRLIGELVKRSIY